MSIQDERLYARALRNKARQTIEYAAAVQIDTHLTQKEFDAKALAHYEHNIIKHADGTICRCREGRQ
jgi:hypothetical protein